jgi:hypothetical protein
MHALDKMGFAVWWREGRSSWPFQRISCVQLPLPAIRREIVLWGLIAAGNLAYWLAVTVTTARRFALLAFGRFRFADEL